MAALLNGNRIDNWIDGARVAGVEVLHYTGWEIDQGGETATLFIDERGGASLQRLVDRPLGNVAW